jgi:hypothetical protein
MTEHYENGFKNGQLCRKNSNQKSQPPTDKEWADAFVDGEFGDPTDSEGMAEFVRGCKDGWRKASGASKL